MKPVDEALYRAHRSVRDTAARKRAIRMPTVQPRLSETPGRIRHAGLPMGAHNDEIYQGLFRLTEEELAALKAEGVI